MQECIDKLMKKKVTVDEEILDGVFVRFDLANKGRIQRLAMVQIVWHMGKIAN